MGTVKLGQASKAASTVAESFHEDQVHTTTDAIKSPIVSDQAFKPEYGLQCPISGKYYSEQVNGIPHIVCARLSEQQCTMLTGKPQQRYESLVPKVSGYCTGIPLPYDIYGDGPIHILFLTGLGMSRTSWLPQLEYFSKKPEYSCLVIDNRGYNSLEAVIPLKIAGSKRMARDMRLALTEIGWTRPKSVHVVGLSMGGMVALQMGRVCPDLIASMHLVSTAAKYKAPEFKTVNVVNSLHLLKKTSDQCKAQRLLDLLFTPDFLYAHDPDWPEWENNRERFLCPKNIHMFLAKNQNLFNFYTQALACARHSLRPEKLWEISSKIRYIYISSADHDALFHQDCAVDMMVGLNAQGRSYHGGHMIPWQFKDEFNADQEAMILRAEREYAEYPPLNAISGVEPQVDAIPAANVAGFV